jgi:hypothetical protein
MRRSISAFLAIAAIGGTLILTVPAQAAGTTSANLIVNPGAEAAAGGTGKKVPVPGWTITMGTNFTAVKYGTKGFPTKSGPGPTTRGKNFFAGGPQTSPTEVLATQTADLSAFASAVDAGTATYKASGYFGGTLKELDNASVSFQFFDASHTALSSFPMTIGPVTNTQRKGKTGLLSRSGTGSIPVGARFVTFTLGLFGDQGPYDNGYTDNLSFLVLTP